ncbi:MULTISPECIES: dipeptide/oligopeptide/nickel ABC transporter permease/ATP-binding protein [unclassified Microbacterium]|uniref:dipeptide/oligopeptide/nickel ABC transporter permease/ATP-binding protein n=1 Tax=unclassified Microbacterium TaxID=2609290 RepID=UPI00214ABADD|nr:MULTISPECIES: dipeptide/oligopeptide/nickel ABC transporter permease/ATP-binding protein [unclassified Microbacterium]MCR2785078.1 dipeptide/oligopeptide/nickel ABC transporter permease/ATP-binding protein [Microbacterium sp. zg.B96]WIM16611.1 dipeptide/oligopeptide/nickel ABC transporter permease/ATP-binding protein [Microbacterium sp. zg-B96]
MTDVIKTPSVPKRSQRGILRRMVRNPLGILSLSLLTIIVLAAVFASSIAPFDPNYADVGNTLADPGGQNPLGTDSAGRDVLSRLLYGARLTLLSALLCASVAIAIGLPAGLIAGYYGGPFDSTSNWFSNMLMALPGIIVLLVVRAALGPSVWISMIAFGILLSPSYYRLTRTAVQSVRNELYVDAARVVGLSDARIISRHILSVVRAPLIIQTALICGVAIAVQSGLQFLGLGDPTEASWGAMLGDGFNNIYTQPSLMLWPALAIGITIGSLVLLGNAIRDALEDRREIKAPRTVSPVAPTGERQPAVVDDAEAILQVADLSVGYPNTEGDYTRVVRDVSLTIRPGEVLGLVGESGSGKSQTAFSILGLLPSTARILSGSIRFEDAVLVRDGVVDVKAVRGIQGRRIAYIPQEPMSNLDPAFTIGHQLTRPMVKLLGISKKNATERARDLLRRVGIADPDRVMKGYPHEISGGMAQRVLIAGALSCEPDLIIADEPTTALDVTVQAEVLDVIRTMQRELGVAVLLVTHNIGVIADIADRVAVMRQGEIVETGPVDEILRRPEHSYTRTLMASMLVGKEPLKALGLSGPATDAETSDAGDAVQEALHQADMQQPLSPAAETILREEI